MKKKEKKWKQKYDSLCCLVQRDNIRKNKNSNKKKEKISLLQLVSLIRLIHLMVILNCFFHFLYVMGE